MFFGQSQTNFYQAIHFCAWTHHRLMLSAQCNDTINVQTGSIWTSLCLQRQRRLTLDPRNNLLSCLRQIEWMWFSAALWVVVNLRDQMKKNIACTVYPNLEDSSPALTLTGHWSLGVCPIRLKRLKGRSWKKGLVLNQERICFFLVEKWKRNLVWLHLFTLLVVKVNCFDRTSYSYTRIWLSVN